ncbi:MAG: 4Fe-4S binding protein [Candidatus Marinimicrobia bacterium]|nr:4Fe-4S binding protein [Candidatus Neomarinimicrobiota bacterium]
MIDKNTSPSSQKLRSIVQLVFLVLILFIGMQFIQYVAWLDSGGIGDTPRRPPGASGFLPIASIMSLSFLIQTGDVHAVHPAGLFLFIAFVLMSFIAGKSFCSWVCPFGLLSEMLEKLHRRLFNSVLSLPRWLDYPLRSLKYLLLGFFLLAIIPMGAIELGHYLNSPYHAVADIKMYRFFAQISPFAAYVTIGLLVFSLVIPYFWCRYLCPYGALMGVIGLVSPFKIKRNAQSCIDCGKCTKVCPARILVDQVKTVRSDECTSCYQCVDTCPVKDTLEVVNFPTKRRIPTRFLGITVAATFVVLVGIAYISGNWHSSLTAAKTLELYPGIDLYLHTGSY